MAYTATQEQIIQRIKKLMRHAESAKNIGNLEEAETFAAKIQGLLLEHNLNETRVKNAEETENFAGFSYCESISYKHHVGNIWKIELIAALANNHLCAYILRKKSLTFQVYGKMQNVETVVWLYNFLTIRLFNMASETYSAVPVKERMEKLGTGYQFFKDFLIGAAHGIDERLKAQAASNNNTRDLMIIGNQLATKFMYSCFPKGALMDSVQKYRYNRNNFELGRQAAHKVNITNPLNSASGVTTKKLMQ